MENKTGLGVGVYLEIHDLCGFVVKARSVTDSDDNSSLGPGSGGRDPQTVGGRRQGQLELTVGILYKQSIANSSRLYYKRAFLCLKTIRQLMMIMMMMMMMMMIAITIKVIIIIMRLVPRRIPFERQFKARGSMGKEGGGGRGPEGDEGQTKILP